MPTSWNPLPLVWPSSLRELALGPCRAGNDLSVLDERYPVMGCCTDTEPGVPAVSFSRPGRCDDSTVGEIGEEVMCGRQPISALM